MRTLLCVVTAVLLLSGCASLSGPKTGQSTIGPFHAFQGRLIVIEPTRRWQVLVHWQNEKERGTARLTHAASGRVAEIRWHGSQIEIRDSSRPAWRPIAFARLAEHGIVLPPQQLAAILEGRIPNALQAKGRNHWEGQLRGAFIRMQWHPDTQRLELTDLTHGRRAILIIHH